MTPEVMTAKRLIELTEAESAREFERVSKELLAHNAAQGVNYWAGSPHPAILIGAGRIFDFLRVLEEVVGFLPARRHSYLVGYRSGRNGAEVSRQFFRELPREEVAPELLKAGSRTLAGAGWGRCLIEADLEQGGVRWVFPRGTAIGLAALRDGIRKDVACPYMAGVVAGWSNTSLGTNLEVQEVECVSRGEERCVFESTEFIRFRTRA